MLSHLTNVKKNIKISELEQGGVKIHTYNAYMYVDKIKLNKGDIVILKTKNTKQVRVAFSPRNSIPHKQ